MVRSLRTICYVCIPPQIKNKTKRRLWLCCMFLTRSCAQSEKTMNIKMISLSRWLRCATPCLGGECEECCVLGGGGEPEYQNEYLPLIERCQGAISLGSRVICITYVWICPWIFHWFGCTSTVEFDLLAFVNKIIWMHHGCLFYAIIWVQ